MCYKVGVSIERRTIYFLFICYEAERLFGSVLYGTVFVNDCKFWPAVDGVVSV